LQTVEKWATRSDAWTPDDDTRLASIVLEHIQTGSTQLRAFEQAANELGRTAAACGYRWNGVVRRHYRGEIEQAKLERKRGQKAGGATRETSEPTVVQAETATSSESMKDVIQFLQTYDAQYQKLLRYVQQLEQEKQSLEQRLIELEPANSTTVEALDEPLTPEQLEEDSRTLFAIMERARKLLGDTRPLTDS
jgi:prespore-specific regulator